METNLCIFVRLFKPFYFNSSNMRQSKGMKLRKIRARILNYLADSLGTFKFSCRYCSLILAVHKLPLKTTIRSYQRAFILDIKLLNMPVQSALCVKTTSEPLCINLDTRALAAQKNTFHLEGLRWTSTSRSWLEGETVANKVF